MCFLVIATALPLIFTLILGYSISMKIAVNVDFTKLLDTLTAVGVFFLSFTGPCV